MANKKSNKLNKAVKQQRNAKKQRNKYNKQVGRAQAHLPQSVYTSKHLAVTQKVTRALAKTNNVDASPLSYVFRGFMSPIATVPFRWPFNGADVETVPTAVATLHSSTSVKYPTGFAGTYGATGDWLVWLFRNPLRNMVVLTNITTSYVYTAQFAKGMNTVQVWNPAQATDNQPMPIAYLSCPTAGAPHGPLQNGVSPLFCGGIEAMPEANFVWVGVGDTIAITTTGTGTPADYVIATFLANPGSTDPLPSDSTLFHFTSLTTQSFTASTTTFGYYSFAVATTATSTPTWTYALTLTVAAGDVLAHQSLPGALLHPVWFESIRINATSLLVSECASQLNAEGPLEAAFITNSASMPFYKYNSTTALASTVVTYPGNNKKGLYMWLKPSGGKALIRRNAMNVLGSTIQSSNFFLDDGCGFNVAVLSTTATGSSYPGLDFYTTLSSSVEYASTDQWIETEYSPVLTTEALALLQAMNTASCFTENPTHLEMIRSFVGRTGSFLRKHAGTLTTALGAMFPAYAAPLRLAGMMLRPP